MRSFTLTKMLGALITLSSVVSCATLPATVASDDVAVRSTIDLTSTTLEPMKWVGPCKGDNITLYGDASMIIDQLKDRDCYVPQTSGGNSTARSVLDARQPDHPSCCPIAGWDWKAAEPAEVNDAIINLASLPGFFYVNPFSCALATTFDTAGIWVCNDYDNWNGLAPQYMQSSAQELGGCSGCGQVFLAQLQYKMNIIIHHV